MEDFLLHFCVRSYLRSRCQIYYLTDLTKGAMPVKIAWENRFERYDRWYPLLLDELALVARPSCTVFAIGRAVEHYLSRKTFEWPMVGLLHYSRQAARHRERAIQGREKEFERFAQALRPDAILEVAEETMLEAGVSAEMTTQALARLKRSQLTDSRKKLMFSYYLVFQSQP